MSNSPFYYSNFYSDAGIFAEFLSKFEHAWQALPEIESFIDEAQANLPEGYSRLSEGVIIGRNVTIDDTARIHAKAIIGHNSIIGHASYVRGGAMIGENVNVGHATEVKHSIVLSNTALAHLNYIGDSIVGSNVNISGGATLANWRFDKRVIEIKNGDDKISTGMEKMGSIIGDNCFIGVSAVLNPGTILAKESLVFPLISVKGTHLSAETFK